MIQSMKLIRILKLSRKKLSLSVPMTTCPSTKDSLERRGCLKLWRRKRNNWKKTTASKVETYLIPMNETLKHCAIFSYPTRALLITKALISSKT